MKEREKRGELPGKVVRTPSAQYNVESPLPSILRACLGAPCIRQQSQALGAAPKQAGWWWWYWEWLPAALLTGVCFLPEKVGGEELSSPQPLALITALGTKAQGSRTAVGGFPRCWEHWSAFPWTVALLGQSVEGAPHETGFIKGFPRCVYQEGAMDLHLEKGPALLFIHVSIIETIEGNFLDRNIFQKDVTIISLRRGLLFVKGVLYCLRVIYQCVGSNEMIEAMLDKGFAQGFQRTNTQVLRKEMSFLVRLLKQHFLLGSQGVYTAPLSVAEALP